MNIDDLTIGQAKMLASMFGAKEHQSTFVCREIGNYVVVRTFAAGVHVGTLVEYDAVTRTAVLEITRRIWSWEGAFTLTAVANDGITGGKMSDFISQNTIMQVEEILPCTTVAKKKLESYKTHKP